ncbi:FimV/HubP family polar landmark protein [Ramlibacter aurantiacus]|uniref:FimV/HubP family polar landmark protein n=1 Tax=Ramlibacter aurantiacus TaxID=2801330 RepID=UPI00338ED6ED
MGLAAALLMGVCAGEAQALALGRVVVHSALGEPLRVDIDVPQVTEQERETLRTEMAAPDAFRAAGLEYHPSLAGARVSLQRRPDGSHFIRVATERPVNEPYVELMVDARWSSGHIVRDFTLLLDPPQVRRAAPTMAPQVAAAPRTTTAVPAPSTTAPRAASAEPAGAATSAPAGGGALRPPEAGAPPRVEVQRGETAGRIAERYRPQTVSLDQMLVALLKGNPAAFDEGNVNRLKAGAVLELPSAAAAASITPAQARQTLVAQSRDFNEYRRQLAQATANAPAVGTAGRTASGRLEAEVQEKAQVAPRPDRLTLSKGSVQGQRGAEEQIAQERSAQDAAARLAELNRNLAELNRLTATAAQATPTRTGPVSSSAAPAAPAAAAASATTGTAGAAPDGGSTGLPLSAQPAPAPAATATPDSAPTPAPQPPAAAEADWLQEMFDNPLLPAAAGGAAALLLGLVLYRARRRRQKASHVDSSFLESRLQPDSFFGASGGQRIDTAENNQTSASSMVYSPSQLDAAGDVDPVAEADVYLAYGRDLQAEEILKEALRINPQRVAIHAKLLEIHAKRGEAKPFEAIAREAHALTQGVGTEWRQISAMGRELDPANPLYRSADGRGAGAAAIAGGGTAAGLLGTRYVTTDEADEAVELDSGPPSGLDLDLDFLESQPTTTSAGTAPRPVALDAPRPVALDAPQEATAVLERPAPETPQALLEEVPPVAEPAVLPALAESVPGIELPGLDLEPLSALELDAQPAVASAAVAEPAPAEVAAAEAPSAGLEPLTFDFGDLSLDLDSVLPTASPTIEPVVQAAQPDDSLAALEPLPSLASSSEGDADALITKFSLAEEFLAIGDSDGARSLAEEVLAEASGELKAKVQRFIADIG